MHQTSAFIDALKRCLKAKRMTYADLAARLSLSEASVKRLFSRNALTFQRAEEILGVLDLTLLDVAKMAAGTRAEASSSLTLDQERALAGDAALFSFFHLLLFGRTLPQIKRAYDVTDERVARWLRTLEELGLLERLPQGKVKLSVARNLVWRARGPLRQAYEQTVRDQFTEGAFAGEHDQRKFATRRLAAGSQALMARKIARLFAEMDGLSEIDTGEDGASTLIHGLYVLFRPFSLEALAQLKRR